MYESNKKKPALIVSISLIISILSFYVNEEFEGVDTFYTSLFYIPLIMIGLWYHRFVISLSIIFALYIYLLEFIELNRIGIDQILHGLIYILGAYVLYYLGRKINDKNKALFESERKYRLLTENITDVISVYNVTKKRFTYISPSVFNLRGITAEEAMKEGLEERLSPDTYMDEMKSLSYDLKEFMENPEEPKYYIAQGRQPCNDGRLIWVEISRRYQYNAEGDIESVGVIRNIEERKKTEEQILYISYHDQLSGLYNRRFYEEELQRLDTETNYPLALIVADVNGLKLVNDIFGHQMGDCLLRTVADVIKQECGSNEIVARIGGDEFAVLLPKTDAEAAAAKVKRIKDVVSLKKSNTVIYSISVGFAVKEDPSMDMSDVFRKAEDHMYSEKLIESADVKSKTINLVMSTLYEKSDLEKEHSEKVSELCAATAAALNFEKTNIDQMRVAGLMHDIGKIGVDERIFNKTEALNEEEFNRMKKHTEKGYRLLSSIGEFTEIAGFVLDHHERWNGQGYPKGLKGQEISLQARIIAVADAYAAMISDRPYRTALSEQEAIAEIVRCSGTEFDPVVCKAFIEKVLGVKSNFGDEDYGLSLL